MVPHTWNQDSQVRISYFYLRAKMLFFSALYWLDYVTTNDIEMYINQSLEFLHRSENCQKTWTGGS